MRAQTTIDHYDNDKDATNKAISEYAHRTKADEELNGWIRALQRATGKEREELLAKIKARRAEHRGASGVDARVADPNNHPKAKKEIPTMIEEVDKQRQKDLSHEMKLNPGSHPTDPTQQQRRDHVQNTDLGPKRDMARDGERARVGRVGIGSEGAAMDDAMAALRRRHTERTGPSGPAAAVAKSPGEEKREAKTGKPEAGDAKPEPPKKTASAKPDAGPKPV